MIAQLSLLPSAGLEKVAEGPFPLHARSLSVRLPATCGLNSAAIQIPMMEML